MPVFKYYHTKKIKNPPVNWKIKKLRKFLNPNFKILDIGCSTGTLFFVLRSIIKKENYFGIDYNQISVKLAQEEGLQVKYCDIKKDNIPFDIKFDIIYMSHILEHFYTHEQINVIEKITKKLKKGGYLFIFAPTPYHWYFWDDFTHCRPCTHGSISQLLLNFNYKIYEAKYSLLRFFPNNLQRYLRLPPLRWFLWEVYVIGQKLV